MSIGMSECGPDCACGKAGQKHAKLTPNEQRKVILQNLRNSTLNPEARRAISVRIETVMEDDFRVST